MKPALLEDLSRHEEILSSYQQRSTRIDIFWDRKSRFVRGRIVRDGTAVAATVRGLLQRKVEFAELPLVKNYLSNSAVCIHCDHIEIWPKLLGGMGGRLSMSLYSKIMTGDTKLNDILLGMIGANNPTMKKVYQMELDRRFNTYEEWIHKGAKDLCDARTNLLTLAQSNDMNVFIRAMNGLIYSLEQDSVDIAGIRNLKGVYDELFTRVAEFNNREIIGLQKLTEAFGLALNALVQHCQAKHITIPLSQKKGMQAEIWQKAHHLVECAKEWNLNLEVRYHLTFIEEQARQLLTDDLIFLAEQFSQLQLHEVSKNLIPEALFRETVKCSNADRFLRKTGWIEEVEKELIRFVTVDAQFYKKHVQKITEIKNWQEHYAIIEYLKVVIKCSKNEIFKKQAAFDLASYIPNEKSIVNPKKFVTLSRSKTDNKEEAPFLDIDVSGDGACLFHAIALGLQLNENAKLSSRDLRNVAASHLVYNRELHTESIKAQLTNLFYQNREIPHDDPRKNQFPGIPHAFKTKLINAVQAGLEAEQSYANSEKGVNDYINHMFDPTTWGGEIELGVLADLLNLQFLIYDRKEAIEPRHPFIGPSEAPKVHLLFDGDHYGLRIPKASFDFEDVPKKASSGVDPSEESCREFSRTDYTWNEMPKEIQLKLYQVFWELANSKTLLENETTIRFKGLLTQLENQNPSLAQSAQPSIELIHQNLECEEFWFEIARCREKVEQKIKNQRPQVCKFKEPVRFFVGREKELEDIEKELTFTKENISKVKIVALKGLNGVGKTQLSRKFAAKNYANYSLLYVFDGHSEEALDEGYQDLAYQLKIDMAGILSIADIRNRVNVELEIRKKWLLIFDGVNNAKLLSSLIEKLPQIGGCVLITSTMRVKEAEIIELQKMNRTESVKLLKEIIPKDKWNNEETLHNLAKLLGDLPLTLAQAGTYIKNRKGKYNATEYLASFSMRFRSSSDYQKSIAEAWNESITDIKGKYPFAYETLIFFAFLNSKKIPSDWIKIWLKKLKVKGDLDEMQDTIIDILSEEYSLIQYKKENIFISALLQQTIRENVIDNSKRERTMWFVLDLVEKKFNSYDDQDPKTWHVASECLPHAITITNHLLKQYPGEDDLKSLQKETIKKIGNLFFVMGTYAFQRENFSQAKRPFEKALYIYNILYGENNLKTYSCQNSLQALEEIEKNLSESISDSESDSEISISEESVSDREELFIDDEDDSSIEVLFKRSLLRDIASFNKLEEKAKQNDPDALFALGILQEKKAKNLNNSTFYDHAITNYKKAAMAGSIEAKSCLEQKGFFIPQESTQYEKISDENLGEYCNVLEERLQQPTIEREQQSWEKTLRFGKWQGILDSVKNYSA